MLALNVRLAAEENMAACGPASSENAKYHKRLWLGRTALGAENRTQKSQIKCHRLPERAHSYG
jgi:hypothetical protein